MVCLGNICRSPMAAVVTAQKVDEAGLHGRVEIASAGTGDWHIGQPADGRAQSALARRGYDGAAHRAQQVQLRHLDEFDLLLAMDAQNLQDLVTMPAESGHEERLAMFRSFEPGAPTGTQSSVPDPYWGSDADFDHALDLVEAAADGLVAALSEHLDP